MTIYLDNAATTKIRPEVVEEMLPWLSEKFGNPSSIYSLGREAKLAIELSRKKIADLLSCSPSEIIFTSSGTESTNTALIGAVRDLGCKSIISTKLEHSATISCLNYLKKNYAVDITCLPVNTKGYFSLHDLENELIKRKHPCLVSLMYVNNEIGNIYPIQEISQIVKKHHGLFHVDGVQAVGHYKIQLSDSNVGFLSASGHKFHGPKGIGFLYIHSSKQLNPLIQGGSQERNLRAGTENTAAIVGIAKALELSLENLTKEKIYISELKQYCIQQLNLKIPQVIFNGDYEKSSYTILSLGFEKNTKNDMLAIQLDTHGICLSSGSACSSGTERTSPVIEEISAGKPQSTIRVSFSNENTKEEIDTFINTLQGCLEK